MTRSDPEPAPADPPARRGRGRPAIGRSTALTPAAILDAADAIVREDGLDALTMQRLASDLGVTVKALYNHVGSKADLLSQLVSRVWEEVFAGISVDTTDLREWFVQLQLQVRAEWMQRLDLATLAMAVSEPGPALTEGTRIVTQALTFAGARDVPLVYNAAQTFTLGSVAIAASRRRASQYFGRDMDANLAEALAHAAAHGADADHLGVIEAQFEPGDDKHFERGLRALLDAILVIEPAPSPTAPTDD